MQPQPCKHYSLLFVHTLRETKMGLYSRDIQICLCRVIQISAEFSCIFIQRHPLVYSALIVFFILYISLSYICSFLVYMSPSLVCTAIYVRIFWSSEQTQFVYVKRKEKKRDKDRVETKHPNSPNYERHGLLIKYPSQNATSRRRNFTGRKLDVYGDLEHKAKDLSEVFQNEFTSKNARFRQSRSFKIKEDSLDYGFSRDKAEAPTNQNLISEPLIRDLAAFGVGNGSPEKETEDKHGEKEAQDRSNKSGELIEDDQKNPMDLGIAVTERTKRLESLIARRRARKKLKLQIENGLIDMKSVIPGQIAPLFITRVNPFDSPKEFGDIEMPGSAPSVLRSPFDIPYDPLEEKPNLTGDSFAQEFTGLQKDAAFSRHESFIYGPFFPLEPRQERLPFLRNRRHLGKGNHEWFGQLSKQGSESESKAPNPLSGGEETTHEVDEKCETDMENIGHEEVENAHATMSMSDHTSEQDLIQKIANVERDIDSVYESLPTLADKNQENMFFSDRQISHTPSYSLASDLQVEVSEVGSPTLTVDESYDTIAATDGESIIYDGDIDKDVTSGSEDMWGDSLHARELRRVSGQDISEVNNWKDIASPNSLQNIDEENAADVSSMSSKSDMPEDTPTATHAMSSDHNIFGNMRDFRGETDAPHPSHSSNVPPHRKLLLHARVDRITDQTHSEKPEEWCNLSKNSINKAQDINDVNNSAATEQDNIHNLKSNEDHDGASVVRQEAFEEVSINSSSSSSPRSVLPQKAMADQASSSTYNQDIQLGVQQSNMEEGQATLNGEGPLDIMPQNIRHVIDHMMVESHNNDQGHSQKHNYSPENSIQESNMSSKMNIVYEDQLKNDEKNEDNFTPIIRQDASAEPSRSAEMMASEDRNEKSRDLFDDKGTLNSLTQELSSDVHSENEDKSQASMRQKATMEPTTVIEATDTSYTKHFEGKPINLNKNEATVSCGSRGESDKMSELDKPNHSSEEVNLLQSEPKQMDEVHIEQEKLDTGNIFEESPLPMVTDVINAEDTGREPDNKNKNGNMILSELTGESNQVNNNTHEKA